MIFPLPTSYMGGHPGSAYAPLAIAVSSGVRWGHIPPQEKQTCFLLKRESPWGIANCPQWLFGKRQHVELRLRGIPTFGPGICAEYFNCTFESKENCYKGSKCVFLCVRKEDRDRETETGKGRWTREERIFFSSVEKYNTLLRGRDGSIEVFFQLHTS